MRVTRLHVFPHCGSPLISVFSRCWHIPITNIFCNCLGPSFLRSTWSTFTRSFVRQNTIDSAITTLHVSEPTKTILRELACNGWYH